MAVKPEKIKERLKAKWPKANLSQKRLDELAARLAPMPADEADDAAVDVVLDQANTFNSFEDIAREDDRVRQLEANQKPKPTPTPAPEPTPTPTPTPADDTPVWAKTIIETNKKLSDELEALKSGKLTDTKKQTAAQLFEKSEVLKAIPQEYKDSWLNRVSVTPESTEDEIAAQVTALETEYKGITQTIADSVGHSGPPPAGGVVDKVSPEVAAEIVGAII
jgi:hypothetical protein